MNTWQQFLQGMGKESDIDRMPMTGKIRRKITVKGIPGRPEFTLDWNPTHRSKEIPELEAMVTKKHDHKVDFVLSYGGLGSDPIDLFNKNWIPIYSAQHN